MGEIAKTVLKRLDCLSSTLLLTLNWDEKLFRKWMIRYKLMEANHSCDSVLMLHRLHQECHNENSLMCAALIRHFSKLHRKESEMLSTQTVDLENNRLLCYTASRFGEAPGAIFWAMAADERPEIASLLAYHAHRLAAHAYHGKTGIAFTVDRWKKEQEEQTVLVKQLKNENTLLREQCESLKREKEELLLKATATDSRERELRMLRYELNKAMRCSTEKKEEITRNNSPSLLLEKDSPCPFQNTECCDKIKDGHCSLENLKVALIGGLERMEKQYRNVFESLGAEKFFFHSGCCDGGGAERLRSTTEAADIVVFITRVNSHNALNVLRGVCKKSGKAFLAVRETGPEQVSRVVMNELNRTMAETNVI